jgi:hypothetical protein
MTTDALFVMKNAEEETMPKTLDRSVPINISGKEISENQALSDGKRTTIYGQRAPKSTNVN